MIALVRYQGDLLLRSHRWIPPMILYMLGVAGLGGTGLPHGAGLAEGMRWSALLLVPCVAWLTRALLTAEPGAARACIAAASGPRRAQLAALISAVAAGLVLAAAGIIWELVSCGLISEPVKHGAIEVGATAAAVSHGLLAAITCVLVGSAIGAACNPPMVLRPAAGMLGTGGAVVVALAWNVSPANAAVSSPNSAVQPSFWPVGLPIVVAVLLAAVAWVASAWLAARRLPAD